MEDIGQTETTYTKGRPLEWLRRPVQVSTNLSWFWNDLEEQKKLRKVIKITCDKNEKIASSAS